MLISKVVLERGLIKGEREVGGGRGEGGGKNFIFPEMFGLDIPYPIKYNFLN